MGFFNSFLPPFIHRQHKKKVKPLTPNKGFIIPNTNIIPSQNKDGISKGAVDRVPVSSLPKGIVGIPEMDHHNCPPHHKYSSPLINIAKIPKWLHSHPHSVHFDKGEVLPHHRLIGGNPATWSPFKLAKGKQQVKNIPKNKGMVRKFKGLGKVLEQGQNKDGISKGAVYRVPVSSLPK